MRAILPTFLVLAALAAAPGLAQAPAAPTKPLLTEPAISPDRAEIAFVSGGDIWTVPAAGGDARLLVSHPATESRPAWSPDGRRLAFTSMRTGNGDIYVLDLASGALRRVTWDDALDLLDGWSPDGRWLYFTSARGDIQGMNDIWRVAATGGTPMPVAADRFTNEFWAAPSPDGRSLAITARGTVSGQWWRRGHSHLDESEIWLVQDLDHPRYEAVTTGGVKDAWPMWGADGRTLYFVRDDHGVENVWAAPAAPGGTPRAVTHFTDGRVLWPRASADGRAIVFERDLAVWLLDPATGDAHQVPVALRGAPAGAATEHVRLSDGFGDLALSPDGRKVAFTARGDVFAASAKDGGDAERVTATTAREQQVAWFPDSRRLLYVSSRAGYAQLFVFDLGTHTETALTDDPRGDINPRISPDGRSVAFARGGRDLAVVDAGTRAVRTLATGFFDRLPFTSDQDIAWSPDNRWIAYASAGASMFNTVYVVPAAGGDARPISFVPNVFGGGVSWSPDGKYVLFTTTQRTEPAQLARVDLVPRTPLFREDQFRDLFRQPSRPAPEPAPATPAAAPQRPGARSGAQAAARDTAARAPADTAARNPVRIVFDDIRRRVSFLPVGVEASAALIAPDGKSVLLVASAAGQQNLYTYSLDELAREEPVARQLTSTPGFKGDAQWSPDSKEVWYLQNGRINAITVEGRTNRQLNVTAELDVDFEAQKLVMFDEAYRFLRDGFHDSTMNGVDWGAVHARYAPWAAGARTPDEERRVIALMIGELNASHCGVSGPGGTAPYSGRLGLDFDRAEYERNGKLRVANVIPLGPAAVAGGIAAGDYVVAVEGARLGAGTDLDSVLAFSVGREVTLAVSHAADGSSPADVRVKPVNLGAERALRYRQWVEEKRAYVARVSGGRLGYVHMADMGEGSLRQLFLDLDSENRGRDGVVLDIRHNNGGFVNAYALDVIARRGYLTMTYRGAPVSAPARTVLGQRALERPTILVTDQHSLSDAEDFTEGYRALQLGKVVGEPTAGWIIYTSSATLIDGSSVRMPFITVRGSDGQVMEMHPRPVDVAVVRPVGESYAGRDSQLDAAVRELLGQIDRR